MIEGLIFPEGWLARKQIVDDHGVGMSTLNKWIMAHRDAGVVSQKDRELAPENERRQRVNRILREERDILKKATQFFASHGGHERHWSGECPTP